MLTDVYAKGHDAVDVSQGSDLHAFAQVFENQRRGALRLAFAMTGDAHLAEDVVAEAFAHMFRQWTAGRVRDPETYLRSAVVNEVRTVWRRLQIRRRYAATERSGELTTSNGFDRVADADVLQQALATLPPRVRAVVVLRVVEDLSEQQTAAALGCSVGTVKGYLSRGLDRLREALTESEGDSDE